MPRDRGGGAPYAAHAQAFRHRRERVEGCSCALAQTPAAPWAAGDATLRRGDVLVTATGALVFDGARFVELPRRSRATRAPAAAAFDALLEHLRARGRRLAAWRRSRTPGYRRPHRPRQSSPPRTNARLAGPPARRDARRGGPGAFSELGPGAVECLSARLRRKPDAGSRQRRVEERFITASAQHHAPRWRGRLSGRKGRVRSPRD